MKLGRKVAGTLYQSPLNHTGYAVRDLFPLGKMTPLLKNAIDDVRYPPVRTALVARMSRVNRSHA